jgi:hypothetical protein
VTAIPLGRRLRGASSNLPGRPDPNKIPKQMLRTCFAPSLFGLAPGGVCPAAGVTANAVRSYRTFSPLPRPTQHAAAVCFLWHCPWVRTRRMLSGTACPRSPDFPLRQPFGSAGAAVRPTDSNRDGHGGPPRQVAKQTGMPQELTIERNKGATRSVALRARAAIVLARPRLASSSCKVPRVDGSAMPSTRPGRKWR